MQISRNIFPLSEVLGQSGLNAIFPLRRFIEIRRLLAQGLENDLTFLFDRIHGHFLANAIESFQFDDARLGCHDVLFDGWK